MCRTPARRLPPKRSRTENAPSPENSRVYDARSVARRNSPDRLVGGCQITSADGRRDARIRVQGRFGIRIQDPQFYAKTAQELLNRAAWIAKVFDGKSSQYFGYLPRMRFAIKPVPADLAPFILQAAARAFIPEHIRSAARPSQSDLLTLHESAPGHAFQIPIALEHKNQPEFRRLTTFPRTGKVGRFIVKSWARKWGYETPYERFGMLLSNLARSATVVDTGVHSKG
jgi:uncharacterized protein (DUF885 family)